MSPEALYTWNLIHRITKDNTGVPNKVASANVPPGVYDHGNSTKAKKTI